MLFGRRPGSGLSPSSTSPRSSLLAPLGAAAPAAAATAEAGFAAAMSALSASLATLTSDDEARSFSFFRLASTRSPPKGPSGAAGSDREARVTLERERKVPRTSNNADVAAALSGASRLAGALQQQHQQQQQEEEQRQHQQQQQQQQNGNEKKEDEEQQQQRAGFPRSPPRPNILRPSFPIHFPDGFFGPLLYGRPGDRARLENLAELRRRQEELHNAVQQRIEEIQREAQEQEEEEEEEPLTPSTCSGELSERDEDSDYDMI